jgi:hypothetical protein
LSSLIVFCSVYTFIFAFGVVYIYRLLRTGPTGGLVVPAPGAVPQRPLSIVDEPLERPVPTVPAAIHRSATGRQPW